MTELPMSPLRLLKACLIRQQIEIDTHRRPPNIDSIGTEEGANDRHAEDGSKLESVIPATAIERAREAEQAFR
jgi:hypothetical protein